MTDNIAFHPVIVTSRPDADDVTGVLYQQPPQGTDPSALRIVHAREVRSGDWYLGACEQPPAALHGFRYGVHTTASYAATPRLRKWRKTVALDGKHFHWRANELVMIIPRELLPADEDDDWMGPSFIWEPGDLDEAA